jgi:4-hydroxy-3-polyprenylbenzoate decarboxylase
MAYSGLADFIADLSKNDELLRISTFVDPLLEITEVTDRVSKKGGKALLFEDTGTQFPLLINTFGSEKRISMALGRKNISDAGEEIEALFSSFSESPEGFSGKLAGLMRLRKAAAYMPMKVKGKGLCQQIIMKDPDLGILPVLKCWPHDGGRFITLPMVHTIHPETGKPNVGMYRMQILNSKSTAMHWQRHKTGAVHFEAWKKTGKLMPVAVALGGDPVYTYAATAPLPENLNEYILAGFLRRRKVKLVKCITNELLVPYDADIVLEGFVDPLADLVEEGPFGDHTGFYSLAGMYPVFNVTCITYSRKAVYPATVVGIPPHEDAWFAAATEKIFLPPLKIAVQPEVLDFHMPEPGVAHNLLIVKINKTYPGQGIKVINSLFGAGQMMFTKYLVVVSGNLDIRNYKDLIRNVLNNTSLKNDLVLINGPLDVLDHSSDSFSFGGKAGIDATVKHPEEIRNGPYPEKRHESQDLEFDLVNLFSGTRFINDFNAVLLKDGMQLIIISVNPSADNEIIRKTTEWLKQSAGTRISGLIIATDHTVDVRDLYMVAWQVLGNSDPVRDHVFINPSALLLDATIKVYRKGGFKRRWPNVVCSDPDTISGVDRKWDSLGFEEFLPSPSLRYMKLCRGTGDSVSQDRLDLFDQ